VGSHGETLALDVVELDQDQVTDRICNEALAAIDSHDAVGRPVEPFTALVRHAEDAADHFSDEPSKVNRAVRFSEV
jgi:hypothetical protein